MGCARVSQVCVEISAVVPLVRFPHTHTHARAFYAYVYVYYFTLPSSNTPVENALPTSLMCVCVRVKPAAAKYAQRTHTRSASYIIRVCVCVKVRVMQGVRQIAVELRLWAQRRACVRPVDPASTGGLCDAAVRYSYSYVYTPYDALNRVRKQRAADLTAFSRFRVHCACIAAQLFCAYNMSNQAFRWNMPVVEEFNFYANLLSSSCVWAHLDNGTILYYLKMYIFIL